MSTREWQRMKLQPSFRRDMRWAAMDIRHMTTSIRRTGPIMARVARALDAITAAMKEAA